MQNFIARLLRFVLKLVLALFGLVFAISLLLAALTAVIVSAIFSLVTGKKPMPARVFARFKNYNTNWPSAARTAPKGDVLDVEVREVKPQPGSSLQEGQRLP